MKNNNVNIQNINEGGFWKQMLTQDANLNPIFTKLVNKECGNKSVEFEISGVPFQKAQSLCKNKDNLFLVYLLAFHAILDYLYFGHNKALFGCPMLKNSQSSALDMSRTVPFILEIEPTLTVKDLLDKVKNNVSNIYKYAPVFFKAAKEELSSDILSCASKKLLVFSNIHLETEKSSLLSYNQFTIKYLKEGDRLNGSIVYNTDSFSKEMVEGYISLIEELFSHIISNLDLKISEINTTSLVKKRIEDLPPSNTITDKRVAIQDLFLETMNKYPNRIAAQYRDTWLTYQNLYEKAIQVARKISVENRESSIVALSMHYSLEFVISVWGILLSGSAFLPIDPDIPDKRKLKIIKDSGCDLLLIDGEPKQSFKFLSDYCNNLLIIDSKEAVHNGGLFELKKQYNAEDVAYLIFTSGSTGNPKGVLVNNYSLANYVQWRINAYGKSIHDSTLQLLSIGFDGFYSNFFSTFISGGRFVLSEYNLINEHQKLRQIIELYGITNTSLVPAMFEILSDEAGRQKFGSLRFVVLAGQDCKQELLDKFREEFAQITFINEYGPTEATVTATANLDYVNSGVLGTPISNVGAFILGDNSRLLPDGVLGELCIGGEGVARGYLNSPELTHQKFATIQNKKIYRTGDIARWNEKGSLEFSGRIDSQININGHRIEIEEINRLLNSHPDVLKAFTMYKARDNNTGFIVGFIVSDIEISYDTLNRYLSEHLPEYMIPSYIFNVEEIPMSINGKVDTNLLNLELERICNPNNPSDLPYNKFEEVLLGIWKDVLNVENVSVNQNFFILGGDSIKAIQITSRGRKNGLKFDMPDVFKYPTIRQLSEIVEVVEDAVSYGPISGEVKLLPVQEWFFSKKLNTPNHFNQSLLLKFNGGVSKETIENIFQVLYEHHDVLRATFEISQNSVKQIIKEGQINNFVLEKEIADINNAQNELDKYIQKLHEDISLTEAPLFKIGLFHTKGSSYVAIIMHHLIVDGVSWRILIEDIETILECMESKIPVSLPPKTSSVKDWGDILIEYSESKDFEKKELSFWNEFSELINYQEIPKDFQNSSNPLSTYNTESEEISTALTKKLLFEVNSAFNTHTEEILLAALVLSLNRSFSIRDVLIDLESHGRENIVDNIDLSRAVGWFTSIYPFYISLASCDLKSAIVGIKDKLRQIPNKGIGYGIIKYLNLHRQFNEINIPQPKISFNYLGQFDLGSTNNFFEITKESRGFARSKEDNGFYDLELNVINTNNCIKIWIGYSSNHYKKETIQKLLATYIDVLQELIDFCTAQEENVYTISDYDYQELSEDDLNNLFSN